MLENAQIGRSLSTRMFVIWPILQTKRLGVGGVVEEKLSFFVSVLKKNAVKVNKDGKNFS